MSLLGIDIGITVRNGVFGGAVHERIQVADTGSADAHIVGQAQIGGRAQVVLEAEIRNQVVVAGIVSCAVRIADLFPGVFVTEAGLEGRLAEGPGIL